LNPAELLARITTQTKSLQPVAGDYARLTIEDILHALGNIRHPHASLILRVKYADQKEFISELEYAFWLDVIDISNREGWKYPKNLAGKEFYRDLARLAIAENIIPFICLECGGSAIDIHDSKVVPCIPCRGTGRANHSDRSRARILGLSWEGYRDVWSERFNLIADRLNLWESIGLGSVKKRLATY
jgi:hypothetical protein